MSPTPRTSRDHLAIALDTPDLDRALELVAAAQPYVGVAKVGLELFSAAGQRAVTAVADTGMDVFLDVKLHDIPTTVTKAATVLGRLGVRFLTLHAAGGEQMLRGAVEGLTEGAAAAGHRPPTALAVTVLTSDSEAPAEMLRQRVAVAAAAGCPGVVCAAPDLVEVKAQVPTIFAVTPGIRPAGVPTHDQSRVATPAEAIAAGANLLVVGRAITGATDPAAAAAAVLAEVERALPDRT